MQKYSMALVLIAGLAFSYGVRPAFDIGASWSHLSLSSYGYDDSEDVFALNIGTTVPYSPYVGLHAEVFAFRFNEITELSIGGGTDFMGIYGFGGKVGLIEMIPGRSNSPYFKQHLTLDRYSAEGSSITIFGIGVSAGIEFMSHSQMSPFIEGNFAYSTVGDEYYDLDITSFGFQGVVCV
ncbi:MAG: hypothetical protein AYK18_08130 [Theionarchaea archaeon DG-70]|nr:MAG: hypothetical protein AYK18_08130 [Theionarchaea archaeon DG-70]